jgi:hypothetical protein
VAAMLPIDTTNEAASKTNGSACDTLRARRRADRPRGPIRARLVLRESTWELLGGDDVGDGGVLRQIEEDEQRSLDERDGDHLRDREALDPQGERGRASRSTTGPAMGANADTREPRTEMV